jgi:hypothetical protein
MPTPVQVPREHVVLWSHVVTALKANDQGGVTRISPEEWRKRRDLLAGFGILAGE